MVRAQTPRRTELRTSRSEQEQRRLRTTVGARAQKVKRGWVGPVQVLESEDDRLRPRASQIPRCHRRQLSAPQLLGREGCRALGRQWNVYERRKQGRVFRGVEADQPQCVLEICEALLGRSIHAKALPPPFGNRMKRGVLQKLRGAPFAPGMRRLREARMELLNEPGFAEARSPTISTSWPSPPIARSQRRANTPSSSSRPTKRLEPACRPFGRRRWREQSGRAGRAQTGP
jgi:hypothetical protein